MTAPTLPRPATAPVSVRGTTTPAPAGDPGRLVPGVAVVAAALLVVLVTLTPAGPGGWSWGDPATELRWYLAGLDDPGTLTQLLGNLALLVPLAALGVLRWPTLRRPRRLVAASVALACAIEVLQRLLPLDRVVSPLDAFLNTAGAVVAGLVVAGWARRRAAQRVLAGTLPRS